jgi:hypothetical protein
MFEATGVEEKRTCNAATFTETMRMTRFWMIGKAKSQTRAVRIGYTKNTSCERFFFFRVEKDSCCLFEH